jgi:hypothetical protein
MSVSPRQEETHVLRRFAPLAFLVVLGVAGFSRPALACSCVTGAPLCQRYWTTDAVFDATVVAIRPLEPAKPPPGGDLRPVDKIVTLEVRRSWKGVQPGPLEITTGGEGGMCGFPFRVGGRYLVNADHGRTDARFHASLCSLTREFDGTGTEADFLASLAAPASGGRAFGSVRTLSVAFNQERTRRESATETLVRLLGGAQEQSTKSSQGRYAFTGLADGKYRVEIVVPDGYSTYAASREIEILGPRACASEDFVFSPAGRIAGRLVGPDGLALTGVRVEVMPPNARPHPAYLSIETSPTDAGGYFEVRNLPPGDYIVGVNPQDLPTRYNPYARAVYPGGTAEPDVISLSLGQMVDVGTWQIPPPLEVVRVPGIITWSDGTPASGVYVSVLDRTANPVALARGAGGATAGADGRFVLELRRGRVYTLLAQDGRSGRLPVIAPRLTIGAQAPELIRMVIQAQPRSPR